MLTKNVTEVLINKFPLDTLRFPQGQIMTTTPQLPSFLGGCQKSFDINCKTQHDIKSLEKT